MVCRGSTPLQLSDAVYSLLFFFFTDTAATEIYTLSLHDALPISSPVAPHTACSIPRLTPCETVAQCDLADASLLGGFQRSEEHTSELQSRRDLVCRLLLEKKNKHQKTTHLQSHNAPIDLRHTRLT